MEPIFFLVIPLIGALVIALIIWAIRAESKRRTELAGWAAINNLQFDSSKDYSIDSQFGATKFLNQGSARYAFNKITGHWKDRPFLAFDYHYETYSTDSKGNTQTHHHNFSTVVITGNVPLHRLWLRPEGIFDRIADFFGFDDIDFESAEFSRKFHVKSDDKRWAYNVFTPEMMEYLLGLPKYNVQFLNHDILVWRNSRFKPSRFGEAADIACGILDRLPRHVIQEQIS